MSEIVVKTTEGVTLSLDEYNRLIANQIGPAKAYNAVTKFKIMLAASYTPDTCPRPYANETSEEAKERLNRLVSTDLVLYSEYDFLRRQLEAQRNVKWMNRNGDITTYKRSSDDTPVSMDKETK